MCLDVHNILEELYRGGRTLVINSPHKDGVVDMIVTHASDNEVTSVRGGDMNS